TGEDERAGRRVEILAVELEPGVAPQHDVELLGGVLSFLLVLRDETLAHGVGRPRVDAESRDAEVVPNGLQARLPVGELLDLVEMRDGAGHRASPTSALIAGSSRMGSRSESSRANSLNPG